MKFLPQNTYLWTSNICRDRCCQIQPWCSKKKKETSAVILRLFVWHKLDQYCQTWPFVLAQHTISVKFGFGVEHSTDL